jgi:hypothetical protein
MKLIKALAALAILAALFPAAANAQLTLFTFDGTTETPVASTYNYGSVSAGSKTDVRFRVFNTTTSPVTISTLSVGGAGFSFAAINGTLPYPIPPAPSTLNFLEFTVQFTGTIVASYSANLQVNGISALLLATVQPAPVITFFPPCMPDPSPDAIDFPAVQMGAVGGCNFYVQNTSTQTLPISVALTGSTAFQSQLGPQAPLIPGGTLLFTIAFTPVCGTATYSGSLAINGQAFALIASGTTPPLPNPSFTFDSGVFASAQQRTLTLSLPTASPCGATGNLNLAFTPNVSGVTGDSAVVFMQGGVRSQQFSVAPNSTAITIGGQPSAIFQTGTTAGSIAFSINGTPLAGDPIYSVTIPPALITIDSATASNQISGQLNVEVIGFDNTYSAGVMSFTFFDTTGKQVGSAISADFASQFKSYFAG